MALSTQKTVHGGLDLAELEALGVDPDGLIDYSASINPLGAAPGVWDAMKRVQLATYPDRQCSELRAKLGETLDVAIENILMGNGSTELIHLMAQTYLAADDPAAIFAPTFGEYEAACRIAEADINYVTPSKNNDFKWNLPSAIDKIRSVAPKLVYLCNPNNPTGVYLSSDEVLSVARAIGSDGLLVLDEAYVPFVRDAWDSRVLLDRENIVVLHSMTKDYALTALRLGYMVASKSIVERVAGRQLSWSVNSLAQAAGVVALDHPEHVEQGRRVVDESKAYLLSEFAFMGVMTAPSPANFVSIKVGDAAGVRLKLLKRGLCVRDCTSFGMPEYVRIGIRKIEECKTLIDALKEVL